MTQVDKLLELFQTHGYRLTLGQLLSHPSGVGYKATSRFSDLRKMGYKVDFIKGKTPSENTYVLQYFDETGQAEMIL